MTGKSRTADLHPLEMLRLGRMAGLVKLRRGSGMVGGRQLWAVRVNVSAPDRLYAALCANGGFRAKSPQLRA